MNVTLFKERKKKKWYSVRQLKFQLSVYIRHEYVVLTPLGLGVIWCSECLGGRIPEPQDCSFHPPQRGLLGGVLQQSILGGRGGAGVGGGEQLLTGKHPGSASGKESNSQCRRHRRHRFDPWVRKIPWRRKGQPTAVFLPGKSHG